MVVTHLIVGLGWTKWGVVTLLEIEVHYAIDIGRMAYRKCKFELNWFTILKLFRNPSDSSRRSGS